jgi:hypothetical protein
LKNVFFNTPYLSYLRRNWIPTLLKGHLMILPHLHEKPQIFSTALSAPTNLAASVPSFLCLFLSLLPFEGQSLFLVPQIYWSQADFSSNSILVISFCVTSYPRTLCLTSLFLWVRNLWLSQVCPSGYTFQGYCQGVS